MPGAMLCKTPIFSSGETNRDVGKSKTKYACIGQADESTRIRLERISYRHHEDHIATKRRNSLSHYNLVHKFIPMPPCRTRREEYTETCSVSENCKTEYACKVDADESMRMCVEGTFHKGHEDHIAGKGNNY